MQIKSINLDESSWVEFLFFGDENKYLIIGQYSREESAYVVYIIETESLVLFRKIKLHSFGRLRKTFLSIDGVSLFFLTETNSRYLIYSQNIFEETGRFIFESNLVSSINSIHILEEKITIFQDNLLITIDTTDESKSIIPLVNFQEHIYNDGYKVYIPSEGSMIFIDNSLLSFFKDTAISQPSYTIELPRRIQALKLLHNNQYIIMQGHNGKGLYAYNKSTGLPFFEDFYGDYFAVICSLQYSKDENYLAMGHLVGDVVLYKASTGEEMNSWKLHQGRVVYVQFSTDNQFLASASEYGQIKMIDWTT